MADTQKFRDRKFCAVLYPEDETHVAAIEKLKSGGYNRFYDSSRICSGTECEFFLR